MAKVLVQFQTDKTIKDQAMHIANALGLSLSELLNLYLKSFVRTKSVKFSLNQGDDEEKNI